jgi:hypothetical protein
VESSERESVDGHGYDSSVRHDDSSRACCVAVPDRIYCGRGIVPAPKKMTTMRAFIIGLLLSACGTTSAAGMHYLELVNTAPATMTAFAIADAGSDDWREIPLGATALRGGGDSTTIGIEHGAGCRRDLRATFADGRILLQRGFDVCKYRTYHTGRYLRRPERSLLARP